MTFKTLFLAAILTAVLCISSTVLAYSDGDGSAEDPYQIANKDDLLDLTIDIGNYDKCFIVTADIDLAGESFTQAVIAPDTDTFGGFQGTAFTGVFDGNNHRINNLTIAGDGGDYVGLFGYVGPSGQISNLGITNANIQGMAYTGGLTGLNHFSTITACYVTGLVSGTGDYVGGLVGQNDSGTISTCYATANVNGNGWYVGGLVGDNNTGTISSCYATGTVNGYQYVGGLAGDNFETISNCYATGAVSGDNSIGGLTGWNYGSISYCYATGAVSGTNNIGGFCGDVDTSGNYGDTANFWDMQTSETIASAMGTGKTTEEMKTLSTFTDDGWDFTDTWFMPYHSYPHLIWDKYSGGNGTAADPYQIARKVDLLAMAADTDNYDKYFIVTADIDLAGESFPQAIIAQDTDNSEWSNFQGTAFTGVFDGNGKKISHLTITGIDQDYAGLFGYVDTDGQIMNLGIVDANIGGRKWVAALVGENYGTITSCYVTGSVSGGSEVGGLVGENYFGTIISCYATDSVSGTSTDVGGLVGANYGSITSCYAAGSVSGNSNYDVGGLAGWNSSSISDCFWDTETSGQETGGGGTGKTTAEMKTLSTFTDAGWDFTNTWFMSYNRYPHLIWDRYSGGSGTEDNPFEIANKDQLLAMTNDTGNYDKYFILTADIDLAGESFAQAIIAPDTDNTQWNDFQGTKFTGVFDGNGKTISNLTITETDQDYTGLFGCVESTGQIKNLGLVNANIHGREYVGGLVGYSGGTITSCYATGAVSGSDNVGVLVGYMYYGSLTSCYAAGSVGGTNNNTVGGLVGQNYYGTITSCYATGVVSGTGNNVGGLVGENYSGTLTGCYATGPVSGTGDYVGGLVGANYSGTLTGCYATGALSGTVNVGGLVGINSSGSIESCFATGTVNGSGYLGGLVGVNGYASITNCYATGNVSGADNYIGGLIGKNNQGQIQHCYSIGKPTGTSFVGGFCGGVVTGGGYDDTGNFWDKQTSGTTASAMGTGKTTVEMKTLTTFTWAGWDFTNETFNGINDFWMMPYQSYPHLSWYKYSGGSGTAADPYRIASKSDLLTLAETTADYVKCFIVTADIDLAGESFTKAVIAPDTNGVISGFQGTEFTGIFDGNGHTISNLTIAGTGNDYVGLFGYLSSGGQIKNLGLANVNIQGHNDVGGLAGDNAFAAITSCYVTGSVSGTGVSYCVGGLVGQNYGAITTCYATDSASGSSEVGGLAGFNGGTLTSCYATGSVSGTDNVGGLVGKINSSTLTDCYATGSVTGTSYVGGLAGWSGWSTLTSCYATGSVSGTTYAGGLVGYLSYGTITSCFWDTETSHQNYSWGGTGKTTAQMKTLSTFTDAGWDFSATDGDPADWWMPVNSYPRLAWPIIGDIAGSYGVNYADFAVFAAHWEQTGCPTDCGNADINNSGIVDSTDLMIFVDNWLKGI